MGICGSSAGGEINPDKVDSSHFDTQRVVGKGGFGKVNACVKLSPAGGDKDVWYAMKVMSKRVALKRKMTDEFFMERAMLAQVKHEFLCNAQYCFQDASYCYICLDLALGGDIKWHMRQTKNPAQGPLGMIPDDLAKFYLAQVRAGFLREMDEATENEGSGGARGGGGEISEPRVCVCACVRVCGIKKRATVDCSGRRSVTVPVVARGARLDEHIWGGRGVALFHVPSSMYSPLVSPTSTPLTLLLAHTHTHTPRLAL